MAVTVLGVGVDRSLNALGSFDDEVGYARRVEIGGDVVGRIEHRGVLRAADTVGEVDEIVTDDEQRSTWGECSCSGTERDPSSRFRELQIEHHHEVVERFRFPFGDVGAYPGGRHVVRFRELRGLVEADLGVVDAGDVPTLGGEPHGVAAFTAGEIERSTGLQPGDLGWEEPVRVGLPDELRGPVAVVPRAGVTHRARCQCAPDAR